MAKYVAFLRAVNVADAEMNLYVAFLAGVPKSKPALPIRVEGEGLEAIKIEDLDVYAVSRRKKNGGFGFPNVFVE